jgi:hypothetical protein
VISPRFERRGEIHVEHMPEVHSQQLDPALLSGMCEANLRRTPMVGMPCETFGMPFETFGMPCETFGMPCFTGIPMLPKGCLAKLLKSAPQDLAAQNFHAAQLFCLEMP